MKIDIDLDGVFAKLSDKALQRGQYALANQALADMNQYVPKREGDLRTAVSMGIDGTEIIYNMPYAKAQFYGFVGKGGYPVRNYTTPGTGPRWDEKAKGIHMDDWQNAFIKGADW